MTITVPPAAQEILIAADASDSPLEEIELSSRLNAAIGDLRALPLDERRGALAVIGGLEFQRNRLHSKPTWEMYWQPLGSIVGSDGIDHPFPDVSLIDAEILADWATRSDAMRHPVLRARFADLAWEIGRYRQKLARDAGISSNEPRQVRAVDLAWRAIDAYLDAVEHELVPDDLPAWFMVSRAVELAASVGAVARLERAKRVLFGFQATRRAEDPKYVFWPFDDVVWEQARALALTDEEKAAIIDELERIVAMRVDYSDPQTFDSFNAQDAADRLKRWCVKQGDTARAACVAATAGQALELASAEASSLTAIAWLSQLLKRYHEARDEAGAARVEKMIRERAPAIGGEMRNVSVPIEISLEERQALADRVAGEDLLQAPDLPARARGVGIAAPCGVLMTPIQAVSPRI